MKQYPKTSWQLQKESRNDATCREGNGVLFVLFLNRPQKFILLILLGYLQGRDCCGHYRPTKLHRRIARIRLTISQVEFLSYAIQFYLLIR